MADSASEALYCVAVPSKACTPWVVEFIYRFVCDVRYAEISVPTKCDQAPELKELRKHVSLRCNAPTVSNDVPVRGSKANGAVEKAVRTWQG